MTVAVVPRWAWLLLGLFLGALIWLGMAGIAGAATLQDPAQPVGAFGVSPDAVHWLIRLGAFALGVLCGR